MKLVQGCNLLDASTYTLTGGRHGDPGTLMAVIQLASAVLPIVALWLAKQKGARSEAFKYRKLMPDGSIEEIDFKRSSYEEGATSASQIESILKAKLDGAAKEIST